ncbi:MAG: DUF1549 domain-containing protein [Pedosphaera sp.]|nr:DUF1549 domain-containing protein [Pedosphaera sp.]
MNTLRSTILTMAITGASLLNAAEPLNQRIDKAVDAGQIGALAPAASDPDFLRRIHLDLTGRIPTAAESKAFLDDPAPDKRAKLIDRLLASRDFPRHLATSFDVFLMERRPDKHVTTEIWRQFLVDSFATNKPLDKLAREILGTDGADEAIRPAAKFFLDRDIDPHNVTRDVGRIFFGMDLQCAQCHDHPKIDDYFQRDYHGLFAFVSRSYLFTDEKAKKTYLAEKFDGEVTFTSVFTKHSGATGPRLPGGQPIAEPVFTKGDEWLVKPDATNKTVRPIPKHSRRELLAKHATDGTNKPFNRNIANRLWGHMMGRALVEPPDQLHSDNPAAHPALLETLAEELVAMKNDTRVFLRELALSKSYQRSYEMPVGLAEAAKIAASKLPALTAEKARLADFVLKANDAHDKTSAELIAAKKTHTDVAAELVKTNAIVADLKKVSDTTAQAQVAAQQIHTTRQEALRLVNDATTKAQEAVGKLPEDKVLAEAAAKFKSRSTQITAEVENLNKDLVAKIELAKAAAARLATGEATATATLARVNEAVKKVAASELSLVAALDRRQIERSASRLADRALTGTKTLVEFGEQFTLSNTSQSALAKLQVDLAAARIIVAKQTEFTAAQVADTAANVSLADGQKQSAAKDAAVKILAEVLVKAEAARQKLTNDTEVVAAATLIKTRHDQTIVEFTAAALVVTQRDAVAKATAQRLASAKLVFDAIAAQLPAAIQQVAALEAQLKPVTDKAAGDKTKLDELFSTLSNHWAGSFAVGAFSPLSPEQICWSMMQAVGMVDQQRAAAEAEFDKKTPPIAANPTDPVRLADRTKQVEQLIYDRLKGNVAQFVTLFGGAAGQPQNDFYATPDQALFLANAGTVRSWLVPAGGNLTDRMVKGADAKQFAEELYLSTLSRRPSQPELDEVTRLLTARPTEKPVIAQELAWALLTSVEFRFKH